MSSISLSSDSSTDSSDWDSSDGEVLPRIRIFRDRNNPLEMYDNIDFQRKYRFSKEGFHFILDLLYNNLKFQTQRSHAITPEIQLAVAFRYYATGTFQSMVGDHANISSSSVCRIIKRVSHYIALLRQHFIVMPQGNELMETKEKFFRIAGFPGVIGAIDGTHVPIQSPGGPDAELFRNRKGFFSINVQAVCDADLRFLNVVARWRGSTHDANIFAASYLRARLETGQYPNSYLLGDNGYACKPYLLTPVLHPSTPGQHSYNHSHKQTRKTIERSFGVLKRRFPAVGLGCRTKVTTICAIIMACCVLHNIALELKEELPPEEDIQIPNIDVDINVNVDDDNNVVRNRIINDFFS